VTAAAIFEGIAAISQLGMTLAVATGVWVAYRQLHVWREQDIQKKRADVAEELVAASLEVSDTLKRLRSLFDQIPEDQVGNRSYVYEKRLERFNDAAERFQLLRRLQIRASALLGDKHIDESVDVLFEVRQKVIVAIQMLSDRHECYGDEDEETRELYKRMRRDMWGSYGEKHDPLGMKQLDAIDSLEAKLTPFIRYENSAQ